MDAEWTTKDVADLLECTVDNVYKLIEDGKLPFVRHFGRLRFEHAAVLAYKRGEPTDAVQVAHDAARKERAAFDEERAKQISARRAAKRGGSAAPDSSEQPSTDPPRPA